MKKALILLNMGGPNSIDEVELFLKNMFADKHILPMNPYLRRFVANIIITKRLEDVKENYQRLGGKSPLTGLTHQLIEKLEEKLSLPVYPAMRYVPPFADEALLKCQEEGVEELILFPLYPQYSTTTTRSSVEDIQLRAEALNYHPKIEVIAPYYDYYPFVLASVEQIIEAMRGEDTQTYDLLLSAHGLPMSIIQNGDPYEKQVEAMVSAMKMLFHQKGVVFHEIKLVYQSKVGNSAWLEPNLVDVLRNPTHRRVVIYPLAFTLDNSETLFELDIEHREIADKLHYEAYKVVPCLNDSDAFVSVVTSLVEPYL